LRREKREAGGGAGERERRRRRLDVVEVRGDGDVISRRLSDVGFAGFKPAVAALVTPREGRRGPERASGGLDEERERILKGRRESE